MKNQYKTFIYKETLLYILRLLDEDNKERIAEVVNDILDNFV